MAAERERARYWRATWRIFTTEGATAGNANAMRLRAFMFLLRFAMLPEVCTFGAVIRPLPAQVGSSVTAIDESSCDRRRRGYSLRAVTEKCRIALEISNGHDYCLSI